MSTGWDDAELSMSVIQKIMICFWIDVGNLRWILITDFRDPGKDFVCIVPETQNLKTFSNCVSITAGVLGQDRENLLALNVKKICWDVSCPRFGARSR